jgi:hypothetical protein
MGNHNHAIKDASIELAAPAPSKAVARTLAAVAAATDIPFRVVLSNGAIVQGRPATPAFTVTFRTPAAERRVMAFGYVGPVLRRQRRHRRQPCPRA